MNKNIKTCLVMYLLQTAVQTKENYTVWLLYVQLQTNKRYKLLKCQTTLSLSLWTGNIRRTALLEYNTLQQSTLHYITLQYGTTV